MNTLLNLKQFFDGTRELDTPNRKSDFDSLFGTIFGNSPVPQTQTHLQNLPEQLELLEDTVEGEEVLDPNFFDYQEPSTTEHHELDQHRTDPHPGDDE